MVTVDVSNVDSFWSHVDRSGGAGACWTWNGPQDRRGKCAVSFGPTRQTVQRVAYRITRGPIPPGMVTVRMCANATCCNPAHLQLATPAEVAMRRRKSSRP